MVKKGKTKHQAGKDFVRATSKTIFEAIKQSELTFAYLNIAMGWEEGELEFRLKAMKKGRDVMTLRELAILAHHLQVTPAIKAGK